MNIFASSLLAFALLASGPAIAQSAMKPGLKLAKKNCTCRFMGRKYELGVMLCLKTPNGPRMARCELNLNNTSWKPTSTPCNIASRPLRFASAGMCRVQGVL
jgi:hypothetical protein